MTKSKVLFKIENEEKKKLADLLLNSDVNQTEIVKTKMKIRNIERRLGYGS